MGRATVAMVGDSLGAVVRQRSGAMIELKTDSESGQLMALRLGADSVDSSCALTVTEDGTVSAMSSDVQPFTDGDWEPAEIEPQWGSDPATGKITKYEKPIPNGELYDLSLPESTVMVVLAKDATGDDSASNLESKASTYLARMANVATIWENQLGIRQLVSELILTPDTEAYSDVGTTLSEFRSWGESNRPRSQYPRSVAARFGDLGFSGSVIGLAYVRVVGSGSGYGINKTNFNFTLVAHEMGHNYGTSHSSGGIMNSSLRRGQREFFRDVSAGETAAKDIYDHTKSRLFGPASMRHAEEIPFARDDSLSTPVDTPLLFDPTSNDDTSVLNGATNSLSVAEVSRVYPIGAGVVEAVGDSGVFFTPASGFQGYAWFSYSLQGDVGNSGDGWLHRGDVAVLVGSDPTVATELSMAPGESVIFDPPGSSSVTIQSQAAQARVDVTRDDNDFLVVRADADASGTDSFDIRTGGTNYTITVTYTAQLPVGAAEVVFLNPGDPSVRFHPLSNDSGIGYRRLVGMGARIGVDGVSEEYFPNALRLVSANNLNPEKGSLTLEMVEIVTDGVSIPRPTGTLQFTPIADAGGVANIEYVIEDAAGNQTTQIASVVLSLLEITSPVSASVSIPPGVGLEIEGTTSSSSSGALSGNVSVDWEVVSSPAGGVVTFADSGSINTSALFSIPGNYVLRATGADSGYAMANEFSVSVTDTAGGENLGADVSLTDSVLSVSAGGAFDLSAALPVVSDDGLPDPPASVLTNWTQSSGPGPVVFADPVAITTTATFPFPGIYVLRLAADDGAVKTFDEVSINYSGPGNGNPVTFGIADVNVSENAAPVAIDLASTFEDVEDSDADLTYSIESNGDPTLFSSVVISGNPANLNLEFAAGMRGSSFIRVRATDTDGLFVETTFTVSITSSSPVISAIAEAVVMEGQALNLTVGASDADGDGLTFSLVAGEPSGMTIGASSGVVTWTTDESDGPSSFPVVVKVTDDSSEALSATSFFTVTVEELNLAPVIDPIADITGFAESEFSLTVTVSDPDLPANLLNFTLDSAPVGASIDPQSGIVSWTPASAGNYDFVVRVDDGGVPNMSDTETFSVEVSNAAPTFANQSFTIPENSLPEIEVGTVVAIDGDGGGVTFAITGGNQAGIFGIDENSGLITVDTNGTLDFETAASIALTVEATDDAVPPLSRPAVVTVNLSDVNEAPAIDDQSIEVAVGVEFGSLIGTVVASDPEGDPLTYAIVSGNDASVFSLDAQSGVVRVVGMATLTAPAELVVSVTDNGQPALSDTGTVTIEPRQILVSETADVRVLVPTDDSLSAAWRDSGFDDSSWTSGQAGVGYERSSGYEALLNTDVESDMYSTNASVWIRIPFTASDPGSIAALTLRMKYDDGYVAYINGQEIARRNAPAGVPDWDADASDDHSDSLATTFEDVDVSSFVSSIVTGENILAIHGLNGNTTSSDMLIAPELVASGGGTIGLTALVEFGNTSTGTATTSSVVLQGSLLFNGGEDPEIFAVWGADDGEFDPAAWDNSRSLGIVGEGNFATQINGLVADTTYFYSLYAVNSAGIVWLEESDEFTTSALPIVSMTLIADGAGASYLVPTDGSAGDTWRNLEFDDSNWSTGPTGIGYERGNGYQQLIGSDVESQMFDLSTTVYIRVPFEVVDSHSLESLILRMKYDDAFVAFINGTEVARSSGAPNSLAWDSEAESNHPDADAQIFEDFDVLATAILTEGENVLAIHGLNNGSGSSDLIFVPEIVATASETSYLAWIAGFPGLQGSDRFISGDPDGDEKNNFLEYAFGWHPNLPDGAAHPGLVKVDSQAGDYFEITYRRRVDYQSEGLTYEVQSNSILSELGWGNVVSTVIGNPIPTGDGVTESVTVRVSDQGGSGSRRHFFRVQVARD